MKWQSLKHSYKSLCKPYAMCIISNKHCNFPVRTRNWKSKALCGYKILEGIALVSTFSTDYSLAFKETLVTTQRRTKPVQQTTNNRSIITILKHQILDSQFLLCLPAKYWSQNVCYPGNCELDQVPIKVGFKFYYIYFTLRKKREKESIIYSFHG